METWNRGSGVPARCPGPGVAAVAFNTALGSILTSLPINRNLGNMSTDMATQTTTETLAANVRGQMSARGWNQTRLAKECGWPPSRITELLQGKYDPRLGTLEKLAAAFGMSAAALLAPSLESSEPLNI